jgi:hypothetical protein
LSTPLFQEFDPRVIPWQWEATNHIKNFDYSQGILEIFFSGSVGSAKTIEHVHEIVKECIKTPGSRWMMVRRALKDLKRTSWLVLLNHMSDIPHLIKSYNKTEMKITFINGSEILGDSYDDMNLTKFQSLELSGVDIEEVNEMPQEVYTALKLRVGRVVGVKRNRIQARCNPDTPGHWLYKYFIQDTSHPCKKVFYSLTEQNPFLPKWYIENLRRDLDPKMAKRMLEGMWIDISGENIYYNYSTERNFKRDQVYEFDLRHPICLMHDFNIGHGKPMSAAVGQFIGGVWHIKKTYLVHGFRTRQILEEIAEDGVFEHNTKFYVYGDASGRHNDTRGNMSDWDIIEDFMSNYSRSDGTSLDYSINVPEANPPIKRRWKWVNLKFMNSLNEVRFFIYKEAADADEGFRLTKLKKGSSLAEDDSFEKQHVTTAIGYAVDYEEEYGKQNLTITIM